MIKIGVGVMGEKRILSRALIELQKYVSFLIDAFLVYESEKNNIKITGDRENRAKLFFERISNKYLTDKQIGCMKKTLSLTKKQRNAHLEFVKKEKLVFFNGENYEILTIDRLNRLVFVLSGILTRFPRKA